MLENAPRAVRVPVVEASADNARRIVLLRIYFTQTA